MSGSAALASITLARAASSYAWDYTGTDGVQLSALGSSDSFGWKILPWAG